MGLRGQIDSVVNTLDTYDNPTSDSDNTLTNNIQDNANPKNNANGNENSDVDFDPDEMVRTDDEDDNNDNNDPDEEEDNSSGFGIHRSVNLVEQIDELSESGGELSLDDGIHDDFH